ncbi:hypothetical protein WJX74_009129 [Apatococcus lobatus]|uniref:Amine oxidase domain-containing protein n=1 Tax=Apatococcus lobatus TaxID=904363 RepID=A0AAW1RVP1_9CHLO
MTIARLSRKRNHNVQQRCNNQKCASSWQRRRLHLVAAISAAAPDGREVTIIGAGMAGLSCAHQLQKARIPFRVLEASDGVGGRVRTDKVDGFLLDRGFQIFLTSYPEARAMLDYASLDLKPFYAGADVWWNGAFHRVADPLRHPIGGVASLANPIGSVKDKVNVGLFRLLTLLGPLSSIYTASETTTLDCLRESGFSEAMIDRFFRPFLGGIFFDNNLGVTSRLFRFVMRMLATGSNCLPANGIGSVADQLAAGLPQGSIQTGVQVEHVSAGSQGRPASVKVHGQGERQEAAGGVVVAVDAPAARRMLGDALADEPSHLGPGVGTCNLYFRAPRVPRPDNILYLDGTRGGIVNNACFPSTVAPNYAPPGQALVSVSTIGTFDNLSDNELQARVLKDLTQWFGASEVSSWSHLRTYRIPFAQPNQGPPTNLERSVSLGDGLYVCGDHRQAATLEGALVSGKRAAEALIQSRH